MSFKRSVLLAAGVALAASMIANATSPKTDASRITTVPAASSASPASDAGAATSTGVNGSSHQLHTAPAPVGGPAKELSGSPTVSVSSASPKLSGSPVSPVTSGSMKGSDDTSVNPNTIITPGGLSTTETIFSYCTHMDASNSSAYQAGIAMITRGHDAGELALVRMSPDYTSVQTQTNTLLAKLPISVGVSACRSYSVAARKFGTTTPIRGKLDSSK